MPIIAHLRTCCRTGLFSDILIDVTAHYGNNDSPANNTAVSLVVHVVRFCAAALCWCCRCLNLTMDHQISYNKPGSLHLISSTIGSQVVVGNGTHVYDVGVNWAYGAHIVQAKGTSNAKVYVMQEKNETAELRVEVAKLRQELSELRHLVQSMV